MPSGSRTALGLTGIAMGGLIVVGSLAGTLAAALAGLFDPSILEPATAASGGISIIPGSPGGPSGGGEPSGSPALPPGDIPASLGSPSPNPIYPTGPYQITPPEPPGLPAGGLPELPPGAPV